MKSKIISLSLFFFLVSFSRLFSLSEEEKYYIERIFDKQQDQVRMLLDRMKGERNTNRNSGSGLGTDSLYMMMFRKLQDQKMLFNLYRLLENQGKEREQTRVFETLKDSIKDLGSFVNNLADKEAVPSAYEQNLQKNSREVRKEYGDIDQKIRDLNQDINLLENRLSEYKEDMKDLQGQRTPQVYRVIPQEDDMMRITRMRRNQQAGRRRVQPQRQRRRRPSGQQQKRNPSKVKRK